jgi:peptide/nickel transport system substrate-binding protein
MKKMGSWIMLIFTVVLTSLITGLGTTEAAAPVPTGELRFAIEQMGTETIDPVLSSSSGKPIYTPIFDYLIGVGSDGNLSTKTGVATEWKLSPDAMKLTIKVRSGIKFHNGDPLTSADVKFSLEQFTSARSVTSNAGYLRSVIKNIETPDAGTVIINYKEPSTVLQVYLSRREAQEGCVLPKKYIEAKGVDYFSAHPVGSGPYKFKEQRIGTHIQYEAVNYPHWLVGVPKYKYLTLYIIKEESTAVAMLKTGAADIISISRDKIKELPDFKIYEKKGSAVVGIFIFNQWDTTTYNSNEKFREAMALAINREEIKNFIFDGKGEIIGSGPAYGTWAAGYKPVPLVSYNPERAKQLLKEAFPKEEPFINIYVWKMGGVPETSIVGEGLAGYFEKVGIKSKIIPTEYSTVRKEMSGRPPNLRNSIGVMRLPNRSLWDGGFDVLYHSKGLITMAHDPKLDALIAALASEKDPDKVGQRQYEVALYMREHFIGIPIIEVGNILAADPKKVPSWPHVSLPFSQDFYLDDLLYRVSF